MGAGYEPLTDMQIFQIQSLRFFYRLAHCTFSNEFHLTAVSLWVPWTFPAAGDEYYVVLFG